MASMTLEEVLRMAPHQWHTLQPTAEFSNLLRQLEREHMPWLEWEYRLFCSDDVSAIDDAAGTGNMTGAEGMTLDASDDYMILAAEDDVETGWHSKRSDDSGQASATRAEESLLHGHVLTMTEKLDVASRALDSLQELQTHQAAKHRQQLAMAQARLACQHRLLKEWEQAETRFMEEVDQRARHPRTHKIMAERVVQYMGMSGHDKDSEISKCVLDTVTIRNTSRKLDLQLRQKQESGASLQTIDHEKLTIENAQYQQEFSERSREVSSLKTLASRIATELTTVRTDLRHSMTELETCQRDIQTRLTTLEKMRREESQVLAEMDRIQAAIEKLERKQQDYSAPPVMDYVEAKIRGRELQKAVRQWQRKLQLLIGTSRPATTITTASTMETTSSP